ncbi:MAG TPA: response regulator [Kineosporiaceae bacterium]
MNPDRNPDQVTVLLVEDDDVDAEAVMRSIRRSQIPVEVVWVEDGVEALEVLRGEHRHQSVSRPVIVLLDLNMPRMDGFEFLHALRNDPALRDLVVFVLTTSSADADRTRAYHANIAGYLVKSSVGPQFARLARMLLSYKTAVTLP